MSEQCPWRTEEGLKSSGLELGRCEHLTWVLGTIFSFARPVHALSSHLCSLLPYVLRQSLSLNEEVVLADVPEINWSLPPLPSLPALELQAYALVLGFLCEQKKPELGSLAISKLSHLLIPSNHCL